MADVPPELAAEVQKLERYHAENPQGRYFVPLANAYRKMGVLDQAEALLREGLRRHPDYLSAHIVLGRCLADRGAVEDAVGEFRYVLSVDPQNLIALRSLGEMASEGGRNEEAARWYRELLAVDPMNDEARQALEALESRPVPSALASEEEFEGAAAWWERPADETADAGFPASGIVDDDLIWNSGVEVPAHAETADADAVMGWGAVELDATAGQAAPEAEEAPAADPFAALSLGDLELTDAAEAPAGEEGAEPWTGAETTGGWDPYAGGMVELETPSFGGGDEGGIPGEVEGEGDEVVTETIAELYARQGFHDRAADVYRELIRRRGGDAVLEARLREQERLAAGESAAVAPEPEFSAPSPEAEAEAEAGPATDTDDLPLLEWSVSEAASEEAAAEEAQPAPFAFAAPEGEDAFAASFEGGFGGVSLAEPAGELPEPEEAPVAWDPAASEAEEVAAIFAGEEAFFAPPVEDFVVEEAPAEVAVEDFTAGPEVGEPAPEPEAAFAAEAPPEVRTVRSYLADIAAWEPATAAAAPVAETAAEMPVPAGAALEEPRAPAAEPVEDSEDDMPWLAAPVSGEPDAGAEPMEIDGLLAAESEGVAASAEGGDEEEAYPWELTPAGEAPAAEAAAPVGTTAPEARPSSAFSFEEFFVEVAETPAPEAPPAAGTSAQEPPQAQQPEQPSGAGEADDDLESFQAWLQSLKR